MKISRRNPADRRKHGRINITKDTVDAQTSDGTDRVLWDVKLRKFGLRVTAAGAKSYVVQYRHEGRSRRLTLGSVDEIAAAKARKLAEAKLGEVAGGADPAMERREAIQKAREVLTVAELGERFLDGWRAGEGEAARLVPGKLEELAPSTARNYRGAWVRHITPAIGHRRLDEKLDELQRAVLTLHTEVGGIQANRVVAALSSAWTWGQGNGSVASSAINPCRLPKGRRTRERRDRGCSLTPEELQSLGAALEGRKGPLVDPFLVYLLSGCRPDEVLGARWDDLHVDGRRLKLADAKTGPRTVYLGKIPAAIIARQTSPRRTGALIFPSSHDRNVGGKITDFSALWHDAKPKPNAGKRRPRKAPAKIRPGLRTRAGLDPSIRLYDAGRHTFTSRGYDLGFPEHVVRKLTGHAEADFGAHARYRHLSPARLLEAADAIAESLWQDLRPAAEVSYAV